MLVVRVGLGLFLLTPKAYWGRLRAGRSPFTPTLYERRRTLPRTSLEGRVLSWKPYLRPTAYCDSHAPEVIALADELRRRSGSDWGYAETIYDFVRNEIVFADEPPSSRGVVGTLEKRCGVCVEKLDVLVALARAGGIPARYALVGRLSLASGETRPSDVQPPDIRRQLIQGLEDDTDRRVRIVGMQLEQFCKIQLDAEAIPKSRIELHPHAELQIGGFWIPADPTWGDAEAAGLDIPLPRLGYDPLMLQGLTGNVMKRSEKNPVGSWDRILRRLGGCLGRGTLDYLNRRFEEVRARGRKILAEVGQREYIGRMRRYYVPVPGMAELNASRLL
ncbi:MAG: transglutaminase domain-containing protein [Candidatus Rokubacteria bacterium]|nr:transglutaminase domain-containing protein [Candidatus Rokubacteria bacterium]